MRVCDMACKECTLARSGSLTYTAIHTTAVHKESANKKPAVLAGSIKVQTHASNQLQAPLATVGDLVGEEKFQVPLTDCCSSQR